LNGGPGNDTFTGNLTGVITNQLAAARVAVPLTLLAAAAAPSALGVNALIVNGQDGIDTLILDDRADPNPTTVTVTHARGAGFGIGPDGVTYFTVENLDLRPGSGGVTYNIVDTRPHSTLLLHGSDGDDRQLIRPTQAAIVYDAGPGNDVITVGNPNA